MWSREEIIEGITRWTKARVENIQLGLEEAKADKEFSVLNYGAAGAGQRLTNVKSTSGGKAVEALGGAFTNANIGDYVCVYNEAQEYGVVTTIESVTSPTIIDLAASAGLTLTGGNSTYIEWGPDEWAEIEAAYKAAEECSGFLSTVEFNQPKGTAQSPVFFPAGIYFISKQLKPRAGTITDCFGQIVNALPSRFTMCMAFQPYSSLRRLQVQCLNGSGIQGGETGQAGNNAHIDADMVELWGVGNVIGATLAETNVGILNLGLGFLFDRGWMKGGGIGLVGEPGSDCTINRVHLIGCTQAAQFKGVNQLRANLVLDSCGRNATEVSEHGAVDGVTLDKECSDFHVTIQAFCTGSVTPRKLRAVAAVGRKKEGAGSVVDGDVIVRSELTGGVGIYLEKCEDIRYESHCSNRSSPSSHAAEAANEITACVEFGGNVNNTVVGEFSGTGGSTGSIKPYLGEISGTLDGTNKGVRYHFQKYGTAPTVAVVTAGLGTSTSSAEAVTGEASDQAGFIKAKTGTSPAAGEGIKVTYSSTAQYNTGTNPKVPRVHLQARNAAAAEAVPYVVADSVTGFSIAFAKAPSGELLVSYAIVG